MSTVVFADSLVTLHHARFEAVLTPGLDADLAIVDPPYGDTSLPWDRLATEWVGPVTDALKPTGSIWLWGSLSSLLAMLPVAAERGWRVSQDVVWEKQNGTGLAADRFRRVHEHVVHLYRARRWADVYHQPQYSADAQTRRVRRRQRPKHWGDIGAGAYRTDDGGDRLVRSVLFERNDHGRALHPTQKPLGITRTLIEYACPGRGEGLVLDPYSGSASTLVAARDCNRRALGAEVDAAYAQAAARRLSAAPLAFGDSWSGS